MSKYSDIDLDLDYNSFTKDIILKENAAAVKQAVLNILLTSPGEKPFVRSFGVGIRNLLFENYVLDYPMMLESQIDTQFKKWEPRASVIGVSIDDDSIDSNSIGITVNYKINTMGSGNPIADSITLEIEKVR